MKIHQMDATTAVLQGDIDEIHEAAGGLQRWFNRVCKLNRSIYGLKQAGLCWNQKLDTALRNFGLNVCSVDPWLHRNRPVKVYRENA